jgi:uncharacterized damage-inducible protein DinB
MNDHSAPSGRLAGALSIPNTIHSHHVFHSPVFGSAETHRRTTETCCPKLEDASMDLLERMLGYDRWMTENMLEQCLELSDEQLDHEFDIGVRSIRETLDHIIYVIELWTVGMMGGEALHDRKSRDYDRSIPSLIERHQRFHAEFASFARKAQDDGRLDETFEDHFDYPQSIGATILQVLFHNAQHRSEIRHMLVRLDVPQDLDYDPQEWEHFTGRIKHDN